MSTPIDVRSDFGGPANMSDLLRLARRQIEEHPYRALAAAASLGFVLGGGAFGRIAGKLVATGLRFGLATLAAPLAARLVEQLRAEAQRAGE